MMSLSPVNDRRETSYWLTRRSCSLYFQHPHCKSPRKPPTSGILSVMLNLFCPRKRRRHQPSSDLSCLARGQIPIAPAAPPQHHHRDFVPWRFSDAGCSAASTVRHSGVREKLHS
jgi:hypothetical protein